MTAKIILNYHGIESRPGEYAWTAGEKVYVISLETFKRQLDEIRRGEACLAPTDRTIAVTFDDGHISHFEHAAPALTERKLSGIFFISSGLVGDQEMMTWEHLRRLSEQGFELGSHGVNHVPLTGFTDEELLQELKTSKETLEQKLGIRVTSFSVPRGFYQPRISRIAGEVGYKRVFTSEFGVNYFKKSEYQNTKSETNPNIEISNEPNVRFGHSKIRNSDLFRNSYPVILRRLPVMQQTTDEEFNNWLRGKLGMRLYVEMIKSALRRWMPSAVYEALAGIKSQVSYLKFQGR